MNFKKNLSKVFGVNIISMAIGIISGLLIPAFLDIEQYSTLKTYTLYVSYIGLFPLGFIDGMYINYGGKAEKDINKHIFKFEHSFIFRFQLAIMLIFLLVSVILKNSTLIYFSLTILPFTIIGFFQLYYQATANFTKFSFVGILNTVLAFILNILLIVFKVKSADAFILITVISYYFVFIIVEFIYYKDNWRLRAEKDYSLIIQNFKVGIFILIGNLSTLFFYASDRWFIKIFLSSKDFAFYSFAISMMGIINVLINSVAMTFYPYFASGQSEEIVKRFKAILILIGALSSGAYFAFALIINLFMKKYIPSLGSISILFAGYPAIIVINALYINLYKAKKQEKKYVAIVLTMLGISILLNMLALMIYKSTYSIAIATTFSFYIWLFYSSKDFIFLKSNSKEISFLLMFLGIFFISSLSLNWIAGMFLFFISIPLFSFFFYKKEILLLKDILMKK